MNKTTAIQKIVLSALCAICMAGFFLSAINVTLAFLGHSQTTSVGLRTLFERRDPQEGVVNFEQSDIGNIFENNYMLQGVLFRVVFSATAYMLTLLLILAIFFLVLFGRLKRLQIALTLLAAVSLVVAGVVILTVPTTLAAAIADMLGFLALFLNVSEIFSLSLGVGYWLTLSMLILLLFTQILIKFDKRKKV